MPMREGGTLARAELARTNGASLGRPRRRVFKVALVQTLQEGLTRITKASAIYHRSLALGNERGREGYSMDWEPISELRLQDEINRAEARMNPQQGRLWAAVRVSPVKWQQEPYGACGGGFWVVALLGQIVVWYNDIEDGFNCSTYAQHGVVGEYWCNQDDLEHAVQRLVDLIGHGRALGGALGAPQPVGKFLCPSTRWPGI
jgi:hypothetical protein